MRWGYNHQLMSNWWLLIMKSKVNIEVRLVSGLCCANSKLNITLLFCFVIHFSFIIIFHEKSINRAFSMLGLFLHFSQVNTVINCGYIIKMFCWSPRVKTIKMQQINCRPSTLSRELNNEFEEKTIFIQQQHERLCTLKCTLYSSVVYSNVHM